MPRPRFPFSLRRFQFRLQTLAWTFVVLGLVFAVMAAVFDRERRQRDAVRAVREAGGEVYSEAFESSRLTGTGAFGEPSEPGWLGKLLGKDAVSSVGGVVYGREAVSPKISAIPRLGGLGWLWLVGARIGDADLVALEGTAGLEVLNLAATEITDQALPALARLLELRRLSLAYTQVSDEGLKYLERLVRLEELQLIDTRVTAAGVERLHQALPLLAIRWSRAPSDEHRRAAAAITALGGWFDDTTVDDRANSPALPTGVVELCDDRSVGIIGTYWWKGGDADLAQLKEIVGLKSVFICLVTLGSAGIAHLRELPEVEVLSLRSPFTDANMTALAEPPGAIPRLKSLDLYHTSVTDASLVYLKNWQELESLDLTGHPITEKGLRHLKGMANLRELKLAGDSNGQIIGVTDAALAEIAELRSLRRLFVEHTRVTDAGLPHLKGLNQLEQLDLNCTKVTDAGLVHLKGLSQLRDLNLWETQVTWAGVAELQKALPNCRIFR